MKDKEFLKRLYSLAKEKLKLDALYKKMSEYPDVTYNCEFSPCDIQRGCYVKDDILYDKNGDVISRDECDGYFCNQQTGYMEDDYFGHMYYMVDEKKGIVVDVYYQC